MIFFYGRFSSEIGQLANRGDMTCYVRLQCDRVPRPTGRGTRVKIHAYPISYAEVLKDFSVCSSRAKLLNAIEQRVFEIPAR